MVSSLAPGNWVAWPDEILRKFHEPGDAKRSPQATAAQRTAGRNPTPPAAAGRNPNPPEAAGPIPTPARPAAASQNLNPPEAASQTLSPARPATASRVLTRPASGSQNLGALGAASRSPGPMPEFAQAASAPVASDRRPLVVRRYRCRAGRPRRFRRSRAARKGLQGHAWAPRLGARDLVVQASPMAAHSPIPGPAAVLLAPPATTTAPRAPPVRPMHARPAHAR
jgi:hypothetical protein